MRHQENQHKEAALAVGNNNFCPAKLVNFREIFISESETCMLTKNYQ